MANRLPLEEVVEGREEEEAFWKDDSDRDGILTLRPKTSHDSGC